MSSYDYSDRLRIQKNKHMNKLFGSTVPITLFVAGAVIESFIYSYLLEITNQYCEEQQAQALASMRGLMVVLLDFD